MAHRYELPVFAVKFISNRFPFRRLGIWGMVAILLLILSSIPYPAAVAASGDPRLVRANTEGNVIIVNSLGDVALPGDGACMLREAIINANTNSDPTLGDCIAGNGADTIFFDITGTILMTSDYPPISDSLTIQGGDPTSLIIDGNSRYHAFTVLANVSVTFENITIQNNSDWYGGVGGAIVNYGTVTLQNAYLLKNLKAPGGGVYNTGTLTVTDSVFQSNTGNYLGGGIFNAGGTVAVTRSSFIHNLSNTGGGIHNSGTLTIKDSIFDNNRSNSGGGIFNYTNSEIEIVNSTLSNNISNTYGGGFGNGGIAVLTNVTISGNLTAYDGGAIENTGSLMVINSTINGNHSNTQIGGIVNRGTGTTTLFNTIINANTPQNCGSFINSNLSNISSDNTCGASLIADYQLGPLQDNGGLTLTHLPLITSPAIDGGDNTICAQPPVNHQDQRGYPRPVDGNGDGAAVCDVGAVEYGSPSTPLIVINTNDSGFGSLRAVMEYANANPGLDTVVFDIPGSGPHTIQPLSPLPNITDPVIIDATTQPGYASAPVIELDGSLAGASAAGLTITVGPSTVRGLVINRFAHNGMVITGGENTIVGNYIGTDITGTLARPNVEHGIYIFNAPNTRIGGTGAGDRNVISGNQNSGIFIDGLLAAGAVIQGNFIGTDAAGMAALGNGGNGIWVEDTPNIVIGGTTPAERNIISANAGANIRLFPKLASIGGGYRVQGNYIGTDVTGTIELGTRGTGLYLAGINSLIGGTTGTTPGGPCTGACNLIAGQEHGITIPVPSSNITIQGNYVGVDVTGTVALNQRGTFCGIVTEANNVTIGGPIPAARNIVVPKSGDGICVHGSSYVIQGNYVGTDVTGTVDLSVGGSGIVVTDSNSVTIGGTVGVTPGGPCTGACNLISGNNGRGIQFSEN